MGVEALTARDAGDHRDTATERREMRGAEQAESGHVPRGRNQSAVFDVEDQRIGNRVMLCGVVGNRDFLPLLLPVGVPGLGIFALPRLLKDCSAVGGEFDQDDTVDLRRDAATARVEALELLCGVGEGRRSYAQQEEG